MSVKMTETATPVRRKPKRGAVADAAVIAMDGAASMDGVAMDAPAVAMDVPAVAVALQAPDPQGGSALPSVRLEHSLQIKDVEEAHRRLMAALAQGPSMILDMGKLATVDTAGVQLLLSFRIEAAKRGVQVEYRGESAAFTQALAVLGLRAAFPATVP